MRRLRWYLLLFLVVFFCCSQQLLLYFLGIDGGSTTISAYRNIFLRKSSGSGNDVGHLRSRFNSKEFDSQRNVKNAIETINNIRPDIDSYLDATSSLAAAKKNGGNTVMLTNVHNNRPKRPSLTSVSPSSSSSFSTSSSSLFPADARTRVAVVVPYVGEGLPAWFDAFLFSAQSAASLFDWLIIVTEAPIRETPSNVKMIHLSRDDLYSRLASLDLDPPIDLLQHSQQQHQPIDTDPHFSSLSSSSSSSQSPRLPLLHTAMMTIVRQLIERQPYVLVEFKPCIGVLFADMLGKEMYFRYIRIFIVVYVSSLPFLSFFSFHS